jgi:hypothetical protein
VKRFNDAISIARNSRGCWIMDTIKGCGLVAKNPRGCYGDCYAAKIAARYGIDFSAVVRRHFIDDGHFVRVARQINRSDLAFVRIGEMGDPSWDWAHTLSVVARLVPRIDKEIVIITKHLRPVPDGLMGALGGACVNTSVSAMDDPGDLAARLYQHNRLRPYCRPVLRVVTCDFNLSHARGRDLAAIQAELLSRHGLIETVFRPSASNPLLVGGVILTTKEKFLGGHGLASVRDRRTYFGRCESCPDMCGAIGRQPMQRALPFAILKRGIDRAEAGVMP